MACSRYILPPTKNKDVNFYYVIGLRSACGVCIEYFSRQQTYVWSNQHKKCLTPKIPCVFFYQTLQFLT